MKLLDPTSLMSSNHLWGPPAVCSHEIILTSIQSIDPQTHVYIFLLLWFVPLFAQSTTVVSVEFALRDQLITKSSVISVWASSIYSITYMTNILVILFLGFIHVILCLMIPCVNYGHNFWLFLSLNRLPREFAACFNRWIHFYYRFWVNKRCGNVESVTP